MPVITTARLRLEPLDESEARAIADGRREGRQWADGFPTEGDLVVANALLASLAAGPHPGAFGTYQVIRVVDGAVIGGIGFFGPPDDQGAVTVGYGLAPIAQGQGLATEALLGLVDWARQQGSVRSIHADTNHDNIASQRVLEKAGFHLERQDTELRFYQLAVLASG